MHSARHAVANHWSSRKPLIQGPSYDPGVGQHDKSETVWGRGRVPDSVNVAVNASLYSKIGARLSGGGACTYALCRRFLGSYRDVVVVKTASVNTAFGTVFLIRLIELSGYGVGHFRL